MIKKLAVCLLSCLSFAGMLIVSESKPVAAYEGVCADFQPPTPIVDIVFSRNGNPYVLTVNGGVWLGCPGDHSDSGWMGDASRYIYERQPYFQGRNAENLMLCQSYSNVRAYMIQATSGETYYYGDSSCWNNSPFRSFAVNSAYCTSFVPQSPITHIVKPTGTAYMVLLRNGGVWSPCGLGWFGDASNGGTGSQAYFQGRRARYLAVCKTPNVSAYTIVATSGERYTYGDTKHWMNQCFDVYSRYN